MYFESVLPYCFCALSCSDDEGVDRLQFRSKWSEPAGGILRKASLLLGCSNLTSCTGSHTLSWALIVSVQTFSDDAGADSKSASQRVNERSLIATKHNYSWFWCHTFDYEKIYSEAQSCNEDALKLHDSYLQEKLLSMPRKWITCPKARSTERRQSFVFSSSRRSCGILPSISLISLLNMAACFCSCCLSSGDEGMYRWSAVRLVISSQGLEVSIAANKGYISPAFRFAACFLIPCILQTATFKHLHDQEMLNLAGELLGEKQKSCR